MFLPSWTFEGIFELTRYPWKALVIASCLASGTIKRDKDTVRCCVQGAEVPGHCQEQLFQILGGPGPPCLRPPCVHIPTKNDVGALERHSTLEKCKTATHSRAKHACSLRLFPSFCLQLWQKFPPSYSSTYIHTTQYIHTSLMLEFSRVTWWCFGDPFIRPKCHQKTSDKGK